MLFTRTQKFTALSVPGLSLSISWIRDDCQQSDREVWMLRKENLWRSRKEKTEIWKKDTMRKKYLWRIMKKKDIWKSNLKYYVSESKVLGNSWGADGT